MSSTLHQLAQKDGILLFLKEPQKLLRYTPKYREDYALEVKSRKEPMRSMGPIKVPKASPQNYLKKHRMQPKPPKEERHVCPERKPAIPDSRNKLLLIRKKFDYVAAAIAETRVPDRTRPQAIADFHVGHEYFPKNSGLFPQYDYGKVPTYMHKRATEERSGLEDRCSQLQQEKQEEIRRRLQKQQEALLGLRKIWYQIASETSSVPTIMENRLIRSHRQCLEEKLLWLEKNIEYTQKCLEKWK
ncbi:unnamed protein product [Tetraodon nigroviridis]|uniref:Chromosome 6 SCAF14768, whole genome shotgun sequence n=2 Tax=Tetraodon nigroviridis TaxID=99883 RepID=Q4S1L8_TETNG|nr:unnamed protein product [Tetraodon nigroviridis]